MQWLTLVPEDSGVQRLKADNRRARVTRAVAAPTPCPPAQGDHDRPLQAAPVRRRSERRAGHERRRRQVPVVLDTRCGGDRRDRSEHHTRAANPPRPQSIRRHIDLYA